MAVRGVSARLCRRCCCTNAQLRQRGLASAAASPADESAQQQQDATPVASTSRAGAEGAHILSSLQFEIAQSRPLASAVWSRLHELYAMSPSTLAQQEDLLQSAIPILSQFRPPPKTARGLAEIIAVQEEAEALYARYRFISNRLKEAGAFRRNSALQNDEFLLVWLRGIAELGYAPAAWRIWADFKQTADVEDLTRLAKPIAHSVLIATMKWVVLQRDRGVQTFFFKSQAKQFLEQANEVVNFLKEVNRYDWIARSLMMRILKESENVKELMRKMKEEYAFDPDFPSLAPMDSNTGSQSIPAAKLMDPHSLNTMLYHFAANYELSKMISLLETAISQTPATTPTSSYASQGLPFFSSSSELAQSHTVHAKEAGSEEDSIAVQASSSSTRIEDRPATGTLDLNSVNVHSFEILIEEAVKSGRIHLAHHYLKLCITAWKQERNRLRSAYQALANWDGKTDDQAALIELVNRIQAPRVSISVQSFYPIYARLKHSKNGKMRYAPVLKSCLQLAQECLHYIKNDSIFFARAHDKLTSIEAALTPDSASELSQRKWRQALGKFGKEIDLKTHTLLQTRLRVELSELARFIEVASVDVLMNREMDSLLSKLSVTRPMPEVADEVQGYTLYIDQLTKAILHAEEWLAYQSQEEGRRVALLRRTLDLSAMKMDAKIRHKKSTYARKRALIWEAIRSAQAAVVEAKAARREIMDAAGDASAVTNRDRTTLGVTGSNDSGPGISTFGLPSAELSFLSSSRQPQGGGSVQAASCSSDPHLVLC